MYSNIGKRRTRRGLLWWTSIFVGIILLAGLVAGYLGFRWYNDNIAPVSTDTTIVPFTVTEGATAQTVASQLEDAGVIRSATAYGLYVRFTAKDGQVLAGDYSLSRSLSVSEIVELLSKGENSFTPVTILPAQRIDQIRDSFIDAGYSSAEVTDALRADQYASHPALADKPPAANLEGYIHPETFNVSPSTALSEVITLALDETATFFTAQAVQDLRINHGLNTHEAIIIASIVEREVNNSEDRKKVAQVFLTRYKENISLGSDPTALYGALLAGIEPSVFADTLYNTRLYPGLPPGPINNVSKESFDAVVYPADTDFLFFVSGDDGNTYFSRTLAEHEALTAQHCIELCQSY